MGPRPAHLNLGEAGRANIDARNNADNDDPRPPKPPFRMDLPSPRTGDVPPALSPLDAFAFQSRALARRFEEEAQNGRRISRLPPLMVAKEMSNRSDYFRSQSSASESRMSDLEEAPEEVSPVPSRGKMEERRENNRPVSLYPVIGDASNFEDVPDVPALPTSFFHAHEPMPIAQPRDYFDMDMGMPRASSPEPVDATKVNVEAPTPSAPSLTNSVDSVSSTHPRTWTNESQRSQRSHPSERGLVPPLSPRFPKSPRSFQSIRSIPPDSGDEDGHSINGSHPVSSARKFSGSSGMSRPQSPFSPWMHPVHRSPSMTSEYSMASSQPFPRPSTNFSRPMSSGGNQQQLDQRPSSDTRPSLDSHPSFELRPSGDIPYRQTSSATSNSTSTQQSSHSITPSRQTSGDDVGQPHLRAKDGEVPSKRVSKNDQAPGSASYIYAKYALPRGRRVDRESDGFRESWIQRQFTWDNADQMDRPPPPPQILGKQSFDSTPEFLTRPPSAAGSERGRVGRQLASTSSASRSRSADPRAFENKSSSHRSTPSVKTESTDRTIRATPLHQKSASADLTAEEHLEIGIQAHSAGETNKSTYHLRLAAIAGLPTAMLLYGIACRHGWGMRANAEEGVKWLRKAVESSGLDLVNAEDRLDTASVRTMADPKITASERKKRKAQYALAIYELGNSSMNGWGCPKDKPLALRCYEIAGSWGDADALAEAGFCYTQGVGCKKDLKKAAGLYRKAAEYGMSMAGNSWIYKSKYMDDVPATKKQSDKDKDKDKGQKRPETATSKESRNDESREREIDANRDKPAGRARSRSIWGRKKEKPPALPLPTNAASLPPSQ